MQLPLLGQIATASSEQWKTQGAEQGLAMTMQQEYKLEMCELWTEKLALDAGLGTPAGLQRGPVCQLRYSRICWTITSALEQQVKDCVCFQQTIRHQQPTMISPCPPSLMGHTAVSHRVNHQPPLVPLQRFSPDILSTLLSTDTPCDSCAPGGISKLYQTCCFLPCS